MIQTKKIIKDTFWEILEEKPYNKYWEMGFEPSGQAFYEGIPIIPWDEEEAAE